MNACSALLIGALCVGGAAHAQNSPAIPIEADSIMHLHGEVIQGCGVRLTGGELGSEVSSWFDVSFNIFARGLGVAQSIGYEIRQSGDGQSAPVRVPIQTTWLSASEGPVRVGENTERSLVLIYTLLIDDVLLLFEAIAKEQPLTLGIRRWGQRSDSVYTATPVLPGDARSRISACLARLELE